MKIRLIGLSLGIALNCPGLLGQSSKTNPDSGRLFVYVGTYSSAQSKGIYVSELDLKTGKLGASQLAAEAASPSFLAIHPSHRFVYAVNETSGKNGGAVSAFAVDPATGKLALLNEQSSGGEGPCHVNVDKAGKHVLVANYGSGSCLVLPVQPDGRLEKASAFVQHRGSSVNRARQEGPHAHGIYLDEANRFAFVPDLGLDKILTYKFDAVQGLLLANDPPFASLSPGSGPRHLAFHPSGKYAYVINEMACTVTAFHYDGEQGSLESFQTISTLPENQAVLPAYSTAEIEVHPSGRYLYGSNRGHDTLAVFTIDPSSGGLTLRQHVSTQGKTPRGFGIEPSGHYLVAANQDSGTILAFQIDAATGLLASVGPTISAGIPVCIKFLPAH